MKVNKTFTLDWDIAKQLQEYENQSQLINSLLRIHFNELKRLKEEKENAK